MLNIIEINKYLKDFEDKDQKFALEILNIANEHCPKDYEFTMSWSPKAYFPGFIKKSKEGKFLGYFALAIRKQYNSLYFAKENLAHKTAKKIKNAKSGRGCLNLPKSINTEQIAIITEAIIENFKV